MHRVWVGAIWLGWRGQTSTPDSTAALGDALVGRFDAQYAFGAGLIMRHIDLLTEMISELDTRIDTEIAPFAAELELLSTVEGIDTRSPRTSGQNRNAVRQQDAT